MPIGFCKISALPSLDLTIILTGRYSTGPKSKDGTNDLNTSLNKSKFAKENSYQEKKHIEAMTHPDTDHPIAYFESVDLMMQIV